MEDYFQNLRVFPTLDFWRFPWTCSGGSKEHVPEEKYSHLNLFLYWATDDGLI